MYFRLKIFFLCLCPLLTFLACPILFAAASPDPVPVFTQLLCGSSILEDIEPYIFLHRHIASGAIPSKEADSKTKKMLESWRNIETKHKALLTELGLLKGKTYPLKIAGLDGNEFSLHIRTAMQVRMKKCLPDAKRAKWKLSDLSSAIFYLMDHFGR